jgi:isopenicillin N synthase-like dioxygenase
LDRTAKLALLRTKSNSRGFYDRELTKNARDLKEVFDFAHVPFPNLPDDHPNNFAWVDGFNRWPEDLAGFNATMVEYLHECERVSLELLTVFALGLDIEPAELLRHFERRHTSFIRMNYYPLVDPLEPDEAASVTELGDMALHHHSDAGAFTILLQDEVGGLQVAHRDEWIDVRPEPRAFVVNTGDMMQVWSNDRYRAALHRVVPTTLVERYSLPYFFNPRYDTDYAPLTASEDDPPRYRPMNWGDFRQARADGDFADYGEEVQIAQYRV